MYTIKFYTPYGPQVKEVTAPDVHTAIMVWNALKYAGHTPITPCPGV